MTKPAKKSRSRKPKGAARPGALAQPASSGDAREAALRAALPASRTQFQKLLAAITGARD